MESKSLSTFTASINAASRGLWLGELDALSGADSLFSAIGRGFEQAFTEGQKEYGVKANERTEEESKELARLIGDNYQFVGRFVEWIVVHNKASGAPWEMIRARAAEWINRYVYVQTVGREMANANQKEIWIRGRTESGCCDCLRLHGRVYRNSTWAKIAQPRSPALNCGGYHCDCRREKTDLPLTRGRPPILRGPGGCGKGKKKKELVSMELAGHF